MDILEALEHLRDDPEGTVEMNRVLELVEEAHNSPSTSLEAL